MVRGPIVILLSALTACGSVPTRFDAEDDRVAEGVACRSLPADARCLLARRFGAAGLEVLEIVEAAPERAAEVRVIARAQGLSPDEAARLALYLDAEELVTQTWVEVSLDDAAQAALARARADNDAARHLFDQGEVEGAMALIEAALEGRRAVLGEDHPLTAQALNNKAHLLAVAGDLEGALDLHARALRVRRATLPPEHPEIANSLNNIATAHRLAARYEDAIAGFEEALARYRRVLGPRHPMTAQCENNLGTALVERGLGDAAARAFARALLIFEEALGREHPKTAVLLSNLGVLRHNLGELAEAERLYLEALRIARAALPPGHPHVAVVTNNLAGVRVSRGELGLAYAGYGEAADAWEAVHGRGHPTTVMARLNQARAQQLHGDLQGAQVALEALAGVATRALGASHPITATALNNLGSLEAELGDLARAIPRLEQAIAARHASLGPRHPDTAHAIGNLAVAVWLGGDRDRARRLQDDVISALEAHFRANADAASSDLAILDFLASVRSPFDVTLSLYDGEDDAEHAFAAALVWQGVATRAEMLWRDLRRLRWDAPPGLRDLLDSHAAERAEQLVSRESGAAAVARVADLEAEIARRLPAFAARREEASPEPGALCERLRAGSATLVSYLRYERFSPIPMAGAERADGRDLRFLPHYDAFVVTPAAQGCRVRRVALGPEAEVRRRVDRYREAIAEATGCLARRRAAFCQPPFAAVDSAGAAVREALWDPAGVATERVWVVTDGAVAGVPFAALPADGGGYLVEVHTVGYLPYPAALLRRPRAGGGGAVIGQGALVIGDVNYELALETPPEPGRVRAAGAGVCGYDATWSSLTPTEAAPIAERLARSLPGEEVALVTGPRATEAWVRAQLPGRRIAHLATHGFFSPAAGCSQANLPPDRAVDPLRLSALTLAGANRADAAESLELDGILSAREVVDLDLRGMALVVLSACETGLGTEIAGEGVQGLGRAFLVAGAEAVVASLWKVPTDETAELFERFYERLDHPSGAPVDPTEALRDAQRALATEMRADGLSHHAVMWGAFIPLVGAPRRP